MLITRISQLFARKLAIASGYVEEEEFLRYGLLPRYLVFSLKSYITVNTGY
ncbi:hypothetical protein P9E76_10895 [Schinkia azotoformans]|uniref:hypothetical protein n=1 Tax=Schinkia azotoformans TaxID=1454 RepID=UPI00031A155D|nr:hypothetical protein [Schinkia azotoformans]MEC1640143.1 hypothetical protein [Schinkia azotoformans]MEC1945550.1 hypothetical protein [Schinkia azotoformans]